MTTRDTTVAFKAGVSVTLAFEPGDVAVLSKEEADRLIGAGVAVSGQLVYDADNAQEVKP
jgi:hypothetical protein